MSQTEIPAANGPAADQQQGKAEKSPRWVNAAFMVEALVLLVVIVAAMAVFSSLFANATLSAKSAEQTTQAVQLASNAAEEFSNDPAAVAQGQVVGLGYAIDGFTHDGLTVHTAVSDEQTDEGTLYTAHIAVTQEGDSGQSQADELYAIDVTRYVKGAN